MCLGIPGRIVELLDNPHLAIADVVGVKRRINVGLIDEGVAPGDWVLLHVGFAVEKLDAEGLERVNTSLQLVGAGSDDMALSSLESELAERSLWRAETGGG